MRSMAVSACSYSFVYHGLNDVAQVPSAEDGERNSRLGRVINITDAGMPSQIP